ncbi:hypothetical protein [Prochlorothrix hollandica]|uniref:hypothetical protein n=1 Tax=Prochlorothrix hollandica TaxID=1223 RepID=UPI00036738EB|nr:hypothetical protein [Prochlorothrix hollandica]
MAYLHLLHSLGRTLLHRRLGTLALGAVGSLGIACLGGMGVAQALPGESVRDVEAWIQAHPTLQPAPGETLRVRKENTAAQRFTYEASMWAPGRLTSRTTWGQIRSESITLFDVVNGINQDRMEESLRVVYGLDIFQDYSRGAIVYRYPQAVADSRVRSQLTPLQLARQGELRLGDRYGYWLEIVNNPDGTAYNGSITVFLKDDIDKVESELRQ